MTQVSAAIIVIGNEILSGKTQEANMFWLTTELSSIGINLNECAIIRDEEQVIIDTVTRLRAENDYVFTSGGIGPTHDDITSASIAKAFDTELFLHPEADKSLKEHYKENQQNDARRKMAHVPKGAKLIDNSISAAPGFIMDNVFVMAGIPRIFQSMFLSIKADLKTGDIAKTLTIAAFAREGDIATQLEQIQNNFSNVEIGSYPFLRNGKYGAELVLTSTDYVNLSKAESATKEMLENIKAHFE